MAVLAVESSDEAPVPDRTIMDGRVTLGFLWHNNDGTFSATDADGVSLGDFPKLEQARGAVVVNARGGSHG